MTFTRRLVGWAGAHLRALGLSLLLVIFAAAVFWFFAIFVPGRRQEAIDGWIRDLDVRAEIRKVALERYFVDGLEDAQTLAAYPTALQVLDTMSSAPGRPAAGAGVPATHLEELFGDFVRIHGVLDVVLWDAEGKPRVEGRDLVLDAGCAAPMREVLASGAPVAGLHLHAGLGAVLTFSAPVREANGIVRGAVVVAVDPRVWLYPLLAQPLAGTSTGEALIVERDGADVVYLSPLRERPDAPLRFRRPLDKPEFAARAALEGSPIVGPYVDYRGVRVLAGGRRIPPSPWALVVKIDEDEALAAFRKDMRQRAVTWGALLVALLAAAVGLWRWLEVTNEVKLARSEARFEAFLEEADDAIFLLSPEGGILDANRRAERMYSADRATLLRWTTADLRAPGEREGAAAAIERLNREGRNVVTTVHRRADGSTFPAEVRSRRIQLGTADVLFAIVRDITERKHAEDRILHLNRLLRTISEINQIIVHVDEREMLLSEACRVLVEHGGFRMAWIGFVDPGSSRVVPEARAGDRLSYLDGIEIRSDDTPQGRGPAGTAIRTGKHVVVPNLETDTSTAPWRERMLENGFRAVGSFPLSVRGEITGVLTVYRSDLVPFSAEEVSLLDELTGDIGYALEVLEIRDENRSAEETLRRAEETLRTSQERLLLSQRAAGLGNFSWDIERNVNEWSDEIMELYGLPPGGFGGKHESWRERIFPDDLAAADTAIQRSLVDGAFKLDFRIVRPDGAIRWLHSRSKVFFSPDGKPLQMIGVNMDITDRKRAEEEIRKLNAELEERVDERTAQLEAANKELEAFSYSVSHDLRSPLRAIDGFSRILLEDHAPQLDAEGKRLLEVVRSSTRQMGQLIDDLLAFSRVGRQAMARTSVDMASLANAASDDQRVAGEAVSITVGPLPPADADPSLMRQVWVNLISNALKFTRPKAERVIAVAGRTEPGRVVYSVRDNGVGFDMAYANKLFGVFQRLHSSAEFEGTGVGLALVQRIVHRHGGEVWAEGKVGEGATFSFSLPRPGGSS